MDEISSPMISGGLAWTYWGICVSPCTHEAVDWAVKQAPSTLHPAPCTLLPPPCTHTPPPSARCPRGRWAVEQAPCTLHPAPPTTRYPRGRLR